MPPAWSASIEWICPVAGVLRVHPGPDGVVGDPYDWAATLARSGDEAEIKGVCKAPPMGSAAAVDAALDAAGVPWRVVRRRVPGRPDRVIRKRTGRPARTGIPA